ncbi:MAG TPA: hypothetical protein PK074_00685 [Spirochaetales bacterium]|nr:hypothetical protein [Spirochaetales bacterium]HQK33215.1 hypothetical protein [Spirochaetales bacterium]
MSNIDAPVEKNPGAKPGTAEISLEISLVIFLALAGCSTIHHYITIFEIPDT